MNWVSPELIVPSSGPGILAGTLDGSREASIGADPESTKDAAVRPPQALLGIWDSVTR